MVVGWLVRHARNESRWKKSFEVCQPLHSCVRIPIPDNHSAVYRGASANELFLQAYQLILWKQCYTLIHTIGFPEELEIVVKDLWALRLQLLKVKVDATPDQGTIFSSQLPVGESEEEEDEINRARSYVLDKAMPSLIDSLGLCYLWYDPSSATGERGRSPPLGCPRGYSLYQSHSLRACDY